MGINQLRYKIQLLNWYSNGCPPHDPRFKKEQIERRVSNSAKLNQNNIQNIKPKNSHRTEIKNIDIDIALNDYTECNDSQNLLINGVEIDYVNKKLFTFSSNGDLLKYTFDVNNLGTFSFEKSLNINIENFYEYADKMFITSCKLLSNQSKLVCGTNKSNLIFIDSRNLKILGIFDLRRNKYYEDESVKIISEDEDFEEISPSESVNCLAVSPNCIVNFFLIF